jgi:hypothetical protein
MNWNFVAFVVVLLALVVMASAAVVVVQDWKRRKKYEQEDEDYWGYDSGCPHGMTEELCPYCRAGNVRKAL